MADDGLSLVWSRVNQAWFLMWNDQVLRIINDRAEAEAELAELRGGRPMDERHPIDRKAAQRGFTE